MSNHTWVAKGKAVFEGTDCIGIFDTDNASDEVMAERATLAAAAPDMLAAAKKALDFIHALPYALSIAPSTKVQETLVDAIAKAEGKQ